MTLGRGGDRIRVVIVDDQALFRAGIAMLVRSQDDLELVGEAGDGRAAIEVVGATAPDIVLTTFDLDEAAARAIRAGASGFVLKDADPEFLLAAIRTVHAGSAVIAPSATAALFEHLGGQASSVPPEFETLTAREREIFLLAARGLSNTEIAAREYVSEATVKTHVSRVLAKLALRDRVQLVIYAHDHRIT